MKDHPPFIERSIDINASCERVWDVLINPKYTRQWGSAFSDGTWVESDWQLGGDVVWMTKEGDVGARGVITALQPNKLLEVGFYDDVNSGPPAAPDEYSERYTLEEYNGITTLSFKAGPLPVQVILSHTPLWESAEAKIKALAEI